MPKQFDKVDCSRGAPMGRLTQEERTAPARSVRLFKVRLDSGGYDDGGAYWGFPGDLFCAQGNELQLFARANSRREAAEKMGLNNVVLRRGV